MPGFDFEAEVLRVARAKWPAAEFSGAAKFGNSERDGYFETPDSIHVIESTELQTLEKTKKDCRKISDLVRILRPRFPMKTVKGWFVTKYEPTADQRGEARRYVDDLVCCSFHQFSSTLIDSPQYLELRTNHRFGSATDPSTDSVDIRDHPFVKIDLLENEGGKKSSFDQFTDAIESAPTRNLILGDFGAGKSMTLREIFLRLRNAYTKGKSARFPIHLNLRDHQGQDSAVEALERHARSLGFASPSSLVRAWRGGFADVILDGFDELASSGWSSLSGKLRDIRFANMTLVREFVRDTPRDVSLTIAGRPSYFDSMRELRSALKTSGFTEARLGEFTADQAAEFIKKRRLAGKVPDWLPARPLLIGYLLSKQSFVDLDGVQGATEAEGWDYLLDRICAREAEAGKNVSGGLIRGVVERLATFARTRGDGLGPFTRDDLSRIFSEVAGFSPQLGSDVILLRLPGIGNHSEDDGTRSFIDEDLADVARAGDVTRFILNPFESSLSYVSAVQSSLGSLGSRVTASKLTRSGATKGGILRTALERAKTLGAAESSSLPVDIFCVAQAQDQGLGTGSVTIVEADCSLIDLTQCDQDYSNLMFQDCVISRLVIDEDCAEKIPTFSSCYIGTLEGRTSAKDLPADKFVKSEIEEFVESIGTQALIMESNLPPSIRVLLSILRKLFLQAGKGRLESAFFRGLDHRVRDLVPEVLHSVEAEGFASSQSMGGKTVWTPIRKNSGRARAILASPHSSNDPLAAKSRALSR